MESTFYHLAKWDEIKNNIAEFNRNEEERIESERREEEARVLQQNQEHFYTCYCGWRLWNIHATCALPNLFCNRIKPQKN